MSVDGNGSNDNDWQRSALARLHRRAGLQWVSLQMCQRQFTTVVQEQLYLPCLHAGAPQL